MRPQPARLKIKSLASLKKAVTGARKRGRRVVFTNGCFDILHLGHVRYLDKARRLGDLLVVALNTDASVRRLKGKGRPLNSERDRAEVLASLQCVDYVTLFKEQTPLRVIKTLRPNVLVKGGDYKIKEIVGHELVLKDGGRVVSIPLVKGRSTTTLIKKMKRES